MLILPSSSHFLLLLQVDQQAQSNHQLFSEIGQFLLGKEENVFIFSVSSALPFSARVGLTAPSKLCKNNLVPAGLKSAILGLNLEMSGQVPGARWENLDPESPLSQPVAVTSGSEDPMQLPGGAQGHVQERAAPGQEH